jgi:tripartite-type tricarboxylate transporter receptor subunit TctC
MACPDASDRFDANWEKRMLQAIIGALWLMLLAPAPAWPQTYPAKAVKAMIGYAPGSSTDIVGRLLAQKLAEGWKQPVIVENRGGAAGNLAADAVAKSAPDGYTILIAQNGLAISVAANPKLPFNGERDLTPVAAIAATPHILIVGLNSPVRSVPELIALAKSRAGTPLTFGSSGHGNSDHMAGEMFKALTGVNATHVPYRGGSLAATDLMGGQIDYYFAGTPVGLPLAKSGKVRALAVTGTQRFPGSPDTPTMAESGVPKYDMVLWQGIFVPAGTPRSVVDRISADVARILETAEMKERMAGAGVQIFSLGADRFGEYYRSDIARWRDIVRQAGISIE